LILNPKINCKLINIERLAMLNQKNSFIDHIARLRSATTIMVGYGKEYSINSIRVIFRKIHIT
jgi:hypothetical protein